MPSFLAVAGDAAHLGRGGVDLSRYLFVVGALLGACAVIAWALRKWASGGLRARASRRSLAVVDVLPLGRKRQVAVVRCYDRTFALGLGDREVSLIAELDSALDAGELEAATQGEPVAFERLFESAKARLAARRRGQEEEQESVAAAETPAPSVEHRERVGHRELVG